MKFNLDGNEYIPLCDLLKVTGLCISGGEAKNMISQGLVSVNKEIETRKRYKARVGDIVVFRNNEIKVLK